MQIFQKQERKSADFAADTPQLNKNNLNLMKRTYFNSMYSV